MAKISLKKDYMDGNILYGKDLNPNFETIETTINANDDAQAGTNAEVEEALTQLSSDMSQAKTDINTLQENVTTLSTAITNGDSTTLESAKSYTDTQLQDYVTIEDVPTKTSDLENDSLFVTEDDVPTKISQLENDDNTVKDADYVHTDNNFSDTDKTKLDGLSNYDLPIATETVLGGIKLGEGLSRTSDGVVSVTGGTSGTSIPTLIGTQEDPIALFSVDEVPVGLAYISGYTKEISSSETNDDYDGLLIYTTPDYTQIIGPYYETGKDGFDNTKANLVFWFRKGIFSGGGQLSQTFIKFSANETISNSEQGYTTPKAVYDYVGALTSLDTTDKSSIVNAINELANSSGAAGEDGATFTPSVSTEGIISWTNDKNLPNPDPVNIKGPKGDTGATGETGPQGPAGQDGTNGQGVPTGGTEGQVLTKNSSGDYDTIWKTLESSGGITELVGTEESPIDLRSIELNPGIYLVSGKVYMYNTSTVYTWAVPAIVIVTLYKLNDFSSSGSENVTKIIFNVEAGLTISYLQGTSWREFSWATAFYGNGDTRRALTTYGFHDYTGIDGNTNINNLQTTDKSSLIAAINELNTRLAALENPTE